MANTMTKEFEYMGYKFMINVVLNVCHYHINTDKPHFLHRLVISHLGHSNFAHEKEVITEDLELTIILFQNMAEKYVDEREGITAAKKKLIALGFKFN